MPHDVGDNTGEKRIVGVPKNESIDPGCLHRLQVLLGHIRAGLRPAGLPRFNILNEQRRSRDRDRDVGSRSKGVRVGTGVHGRIGTDHADLAVAGGGRSPANCWLDHFDDGDSHADLVAFTSVVKGSGRS